MFKLLREFMELARTRKKLWLIPLFLVLILISGLILLSEGSAIAPFIYSLF